MSFGVTGPAEGFDVPPLGIIFMVILASSAFAISAEKNACGRPMAMSHAISNAASSPWLVGVLAFKLCSKSDALPVLSLPIRLVIRIVFMPLALSLLDSLPVLLSIGTPILSSGFLTLEGHDCCCSCVRVRECNPLAHTNFTADHCL